MIGARHTFSVGDVAQLREVCPKSVLNAIHAGELGAYRYTSRLVVIERPDLESWRMPGAASPAGITRPRRPRYYLQDIAVEFEIPLSTVRQAARSGALTTHRIGKKTVVALAADVEAWRAECRRRARLPVERPDFRKVHEIPEGELCAVG